MSTSVATAAISNCLPYTQTAESTITGTAQKASQYRDCANVKNNATPAVVGDYCCGDIKVTKVAATAGTAYPTTGDWASFPMITDKVGSQAFFCVAQSETGTGKTEF
jgi:hypothetical protein